MKGHLEAQPQFSCSQNPERRRGDSRDNPRTHNCSGDTYKPASTEAQNSSRLFLTVPDGNPRSISLGWFPEVKKEANRRSYYD